jgi:hypothetical protein
LLRYQFYKASAHRIIVVLCSERLFEVFLLTMMQSTNMLRGFCFAWVAVGKEENGKTYELFKEKQQQEMYHCENGFFYLLLQTFAENIGQNFLCLNDNVYYK